MSSHPRQLRRILMTADTVGGVWTYAMELVRALEAHGISVILATMGRSLSPRQVAEAKEIPNLRVFPSTYKLEWMDEPWEDVAAAGDWLLDLEQRFRPDVIHLNGYAHGSLPWQAPALVAAHSCVLSWWRAVRGGDAPEKWNAYRQAVSFGLHRARLVAAPTRAMMCALEQHYGPLGPGKTRVIPNGRRLAIPPARAKEPFILAAGRLWDDAKNISTLAHIAPELPWPVFVAGEDRSPEGQESVYPGVRRLGHLAGDELAHWYARASIYAFPARYEPFGLSVLEAALAGCALVLGDIPSLRELWGEAAVYVPPDAPEALAATVRELVARPELRAEHAAKARCLAEHYTPERMAAGYVEVYLALLRGVMANQPASQEPLPLSTPPGHPLSQGAPDLIPGPHNHFNASMLGASQNTSCAS